MSTKENLLSLLEGFIRENTHEIRDRDVDDPIPEKLILQDAVRTFVTELINDNFSEQTGWINCKEKLPQPLVDILLSDGAYVFSGYMSVDGVWYRDGRHSPSYGVKYWCEMPAAPETDKQKEQ